LYVSRCFSHPVLGIAFDPQDLVAAEKSLREVNGGGKSLGTDWKEGLKPDISLKELKEIAEVFRDLPFG
jgi:hypothetical protein